MEYRKLISFGKSSYVVSLPKHWVNKHKLKKGDLIHFDEDEDNLVLQPRFVEAEQEEKEATITVDGKDFKRIQRETVAAYIRNNKTIIFRGNEIKDKAEEIQQFIQNFVALEIMEQDSKKIVTKDFLKVDDISLNHIIRKMDVITRSMLSDCKNMFTEDTYENIYRRDKDVNKFRFLIYRIIWFANDNPSFAAKKLNLSRWNIFNYWWLAYIIEAIGDYTKRIARYMRKTTLPVKEKKAFVQLIEQIESMYLELMKAYYTNNEEIAHKVLHDRFTMLNACDDFFTRNRNAPYIGYLIHNTKSLVATVHTIGRIVYEGMPG
jgi:phosphate uptake regulator